MPTYKYKGRDAEGKPVDGLLEADSQQELASKLTEINIVLVDSSKARISTGGGFHFGNIKRREIIVFTNHLSTSLEAGIPVVQAIADYGRETDNERFKKIVNDLERQVLAGTSLSDAMTQHPAAFPETYVAIVATGEATGNLDLVLKDLVGFLEWREELTAQIRQASIYPTFLILMIIGVITIMMAVTFPKFIPVFKSFNVELPFPTKTLIALSSFFEGGWYYLLGLIILFFITYKITNRTDRGRYFWDNVKLKLPIFGKLTQKILLSKFSHYFSILYSSGIGVIESFHIIERVMGNEVLRRAIARCADKVERGGTIFDSLKIEKTFPSLVLRMIQVGESTGNLDKSLNKVSQYYDREVPASIKKMFAILEPMLIIFLGGVVLFIALAIFLPMYRLAPNLLSK